MFTAMMIPIRNAPKTNITENIAKIALISVFPLLVVADDRFGIFFSCHLDDPQYNVVVDLQTTGDLFVRQPLVPHVKNQLSALLEATSNLERILSCNRAHDQDPRRASSSARITSIPSISFFALSRFETETDL